MKKIKAGVINFLGSNCILETVKALESKNFETNILSYNDTNLKNYNLIVLPGGFSWGDYIKAGRVAKFCPIIEEIKKQKGKLFVLGICNGFQILTESGLLKGALLENTNAKFICKDISINFQNQNFTLPIANKEGRYYIKNLNDIKDYELIKYNQNPNNSSYDIAGLYDKKNLIMGLMPHPERNLTTPFKNKNGSIIFDFIEKEINGAL